MKTVTFSNDQHALVRAVLATKVKELEKFLAEYRRNRVPGLEDAEMALRDKLDVAHQALAQVEAAQ